MTLRTPLLLFAFCGIVAGAYAAPSTGSLRRLGMFVQGRALFSTLQIPGTMRLKGGAKKDKVTDEYEEHVAPKRSLTAYMIFSNQIRPELMKQNPEMRVTEVSKHVATRWKVLGEADKAKLDTQAVALKVSYEKAKAEYESAVPEDVRKERVLNSKKKKAGKPAKDPNQPKKPLSAFMIFSNSIREKVRKDDPELGFGEIGRKIAEIWNAKTPKEKEPFEKEAVVLREKYLVEKAKYEATKPPLPEPVKKPKKEVKEVKDKPPKAAKVVKEPKKEVKPEKEVKKEKKPK